MTDLMETGNSVRVSVVMPFLNAQRYIAEAIESVIAQTCDDWQLLLVDDGSTDTSSEIAQHYAGIDPTRIHYLTHPNRVNRGMSASRNLGFQHASGENIALLDADDVWLPQALERQLQLLEQFPGIGMLYGATQYWYSWTGERDDVARDRLDSPPRAYTSPGRVIDPPRLLLQFLNRPGDVPCVCSILVRRAVVEEVGGFVDAFRGLYEDQAFYAKIALHAPVLVVDEWWARYRQHAESSCAVALRDGTERAARQFYLDWLRDYLLTQHVRDGAVWAAWRRQAFLHSHPGIQRARYTAYRAWKRLSKLPECVNSVGTDSHIQDSSRSHGGGN